MCFDAACVAGLFLLWVGIFKPRFFWRSSQVLNIRRRLGDLQTQLLYAGIGACLIAILMATFGAAFVAGQLAYAAVLGAIAVGIFKAFVWYRNRKSHPSRKEMSLQKQRQQLTKLLKH